MNNQNPYNVNGIKAPVSLPSPCCTDFLFGFRARNRNIEKKTRDAKSGPLMICGRDFGPHSVMCTCSMCLLGAPLIHYASYATIKCEPAWITPKLPFFDENWCQNTSHHVSIVQLPQLTFRVGRAKARGKSETRWCHKQQLPLRRWSAWRDAWQIRTMLGTCLVHS